MTNNDIPQGILIDAPRAQGLMLAAQVLGTGADADDLMTLADYVQSPREAEIGEVAATFSPEIHVQGVFTGNPHDLVNAIRERLENYGAEPLAPWERDLIGTETEFDIEDEDGDVLNVSTDLDAGTDAFAIVCSGDAGTYLTKYQAIQLVGFLQRKLAEVA